MSEKAALDNLCKKTYKEQAIWFLNAFWNSFAKDEAEKIWEYVQKLNELDLEKHEEGCGVDELRAHVFLEKFSETLTVREMREKLRSTGAIGQNERPQLVPLTHYLLFRYDADWHTLMTAPQGDPEQVRMAQEKLQAAQAAVEEAKAASDEARAREREAVQQEEKSKQREAESYAAAQRSKEAEAEAAQREKELAAAKVELEAALKELEAQEAAYKAKTEELQRKSEGGGVAALRAKNELAQHLGEDPLPLRRAKITQEAAVKKAERARQAAEAAIASAAEATKQAEEAAQQATQARLSAEEARREATAARERSEAAVAEAEARFKEAEDYLEEVKNSLGQGQSWWLDRELHEAKAYLPQSKGGYSKKAIST